MEEIIKKCLPTYEVIRKIGEGVYGTVYHVRDNLKQRAVKVVPIMVERSLSYRTQKELDSKISHDFHAVQEYYGKIKGNGVVEIHDFHLVDKKVSSREARAYLIILMEYCPGNLLDIVLDNYPLPPPLSRGLMHELAQILDRLSSRATDAFVVKDLKPSNLLINRNGRLLIGDLGGLQRLSSISTTAHAQFTPNWSAPEVIIEGQAAGLASLIYAYGFVTYFIWCGKLPYENKDFTERFRLIRDRGLLFNRTDMPYKIQGLIEKCLHFSPEQRFADFSEILQELDSAHKEPVDLSLLPLLSAKSTGGYAPDTEKNLHSPIRIEEAADDPRAPGERHMAGDTWKEPITDMLFVWVPSGSFNMGCSALDKEGNKDEFPEHEVHLDGFWMGRYPVTQGQWITVMTPPILRKIKPHNPSRFRLGKHHPVEQVSWNDAQEFIARLISANKGKYHFRLPSEAEWEYAARACGKPQKYAGGDPLDELAWYSKNSGMTTRPVGKKKHNGLGLYDMSGNVYEWCQDTYSESAYQKHAPKNPLITEDGNKKVIRGGSWSNSPHETRCTYRASVNQEFKADYIGFRLVMTQVNRKKPAE